MSCLSAFLIVKHLGRFNWGPERGCQTLEFLWSCAVRHEAANQGFAPKFKTSFVESLSVVGLNHELVSTHAFLPRASWGFSGGQFVAYGHWLSANHVSVRSVCSVVASFLNSWIGTHLKFCLEPTPLLSLALLSNKLVDLACLAKSVLIKCHLTSWVGIKELLALNRTCRSILKHVLQLRVCSLSEIQW